MFRFSCHYCGHRLKARARDAGKPGRCPKCDHRFTVPAAAKTDDIKPSTPTFAAPAEQAEENPFEPSATTAFEEAPPTVVRNRGGMSPQQMQAIMDRSAARSHSYVTPALITFVCYMLFWIPGLILNVMYYTDARHNERIAGCSLPGTGCLGLMLGIQIVGFFGGLLILGGLLLLGIYS